MKKNPYSSRQLALKADVSHTALLKVDFVLTKARERGLDKELSRRISNGEKTGKVIKELMPDIYETRKSNQHINQFRCTTRWLLNNGFDPDDLIAFIKEIV